MQRYAWDEHMILTCCITQYPVAKCARMVRVVLPPLRTHWDPSVAYNLDFIKEKIKNGQMCVYIPTSVLFPKTNMQVLPFHSCNENEKSL